MKDENNIIQFTKLTACPKVAGSVCSWFCGGVAGAGGGDGDLGTALAALAALFPFPFPLPFDVVLTRLERVPRFRIGPPAAGIIVPSRVVMVLGGEVSISCCCDEDVD